MSGLNKPFYRPIVFFETIKKFPDNTILVFHFKEEFKDKSFYFEIGYSSFGVDTVHQQMVEKFKENDTIMDFCS